MSERYHCKEDGSSVWIEADLDDPGEVGLEMHGDNIVILSWEFAERLGVELQRLAVLAREAEERKASGR